MSDKTSIEWTDATWNPIRATSGRHYCERISPGCDNCYAATMTRRLARHDYPKVSDAGAPGEKIQGVRPMLDQEALRLPLNWKEPRKIFVCSMTDLFGEWMTVPWLAAVFAVIESSPQHTFQILTKRPTLMKKVLTPEFYAGPVRKYGYDLLGSKYSANNPGWPLPNVWLGTSVESDAYAWRARVLAEIPAAVRFISAEPLLGPLTNLELGQPVQVHEHVSPVMAVETREALNEMYSAVVKQYFAPKIHWVIAGGESGAKARPPHPDWFRDLRDRCQVAGVAFFFKQWGEHAPVMATDESGTYQMLRAGKKAAGRELDGRTWDEMPRSAAEVTACPS